MALVIGTRLGSYEIVAPLGSGGMGEVYRARDTKLKREVAIKVLPESFSQDPDRLARFQREAELLATLSHPNIGAVYGLEDSNGVPALVLELIEGPTLADRITQGAMPMDEVLPIARQIADALEAAHEKGVVHRDLKPANIKITPEGTVKVLDFGLAKMLETAPSASVLSMSPTLSVHATYAGVILGTAAYMSPEQARGRPVDKRSDIWAFGCVLYEMLTGRRAFDGEDVTETLGAVIHKEPAWDRLPDNTPAAVRTVLTRCIHKDPRQRLRDIGDVRLALEGAFETKDTTATDAASTGPGQLHSRQSRRRWAAAIIASSLVALAAIAALAAWMGARLGERAPQPARFTIVPPSAQPLAIQGTDRDIAISPDGTRVVYRAGSQQQLVVRALDQLDVQPLSSSAGARQPFISPDGHWIGFYAAGELKKVSITGGPAISLSTLTGALRGASWGPDDTIIFATTDVPSGLLSVSAAGGEPKVLTKPDIARGELDHLFPSVLPGGRAVLFTITAVGQAENAQVAVLDLKTGGRKTLIRGGSHAEYVDTGHLVYAAAGTLRAVRFEVERLEVLSDPVPAVEQVMTSGTGAANFVVSRNGTLVFVPGGAAGEAARRSLVWVNRQGREEPLKAPPRAYELPRISPDGTRVALDIRDQQLDVWIWNLAQQTLTRLTLDASADNAPVWTPDGRRIIFSSARAGAQNLYSQAADGTGTVERLTTSTNLQVPTSISLDGKGVVLLELQGGTQADIKLLVREDSSGPPSQGSGGGSTGLTVGLSSSKAGPRPLVQTTFAESSAELSPDGRWLAYESNESGQYQIYVRPFPNVDGGRWQVSTDGGTRAGWARSGRELFYLDSSRLLTTVPVQTTGPSFSYGNPSKVFQTRYYVSQFLRPYDVSPDGQRFLMIKENPADQASSSPSTSMVVVLNWFEELKRLAPAR